MVNKFAQLEVSKRERIRNFSKVVWGMGNPPTPLHFPFPLAPPLRPEKNSFITSFLPPAPLTYETITLSNHPQRSHIASQQT